MIVATNRRNNLREGMQSLLSSMPRCEGREVRVHFFLPDERLYTRVGLPCSEVERLYHLLGLVPDPYAVAAVNEHDPVFADSHTNVCQWVVGGVFTALDFGHSHTLSKDRYVSLARDAYPWPRNIWFGGTRK